MPPTTGYDTATVSNPSSALTDFTLLVDLSRMSADWWAAVNTSDGTRGRVFNGNGTVEFAVDWIDFDDTAETGFARILYTGSLATSGTQQVRIYPPNTANAAVAASATYGSDNAYKSELEAYYADGGEVDRTGNGRDLTGGGSLSPGGVAGKIGVATDYNGSNQYADTTDATLIALPQTHDMTVLAWINPDVAATSRASWAFDGTDDLVYYPNDTTYGGAGGIRIFWRDLGGVAFFDDPGPDGSGAWAHHAFVTRGGSDHEVFLDSASLGTSSKSGGAGPFSAFRVGSFGASSQEFDGQIQHVQLWSDALSAAWIAHEYDQSNDQAAFWGTWAWNAPAGGGSAIAPIAMHYRRLSA